MQIMKSRNSLQVKTLPSQIKEHELIIEKELDELDINFIINSHQTREDNIFMIYVQLMKLIDKNEINTPINNRKMTTYIKSFQNHELERLKMEEKIKKKYQSCVLMASQKHLIYKLFINLFKISLIFLNKVQLYFPRLYEVIKGESYTIHNKFKDHLQSSIQFRNVRIDHIVSYIIKQMHVKFYQVQQKLNNWPTCYSMLLNRNSNYKSDKTNINEKFYKYDREEGYLLHIQKKYLLRYECPTKEDVYENLLQDDYQKKEQIYNQYKFHESVLETLLTVCEKGFKDLQILNRFVEKTINIYFEEQGIKNNNQRTHHRIQSQCSQQIETSKEEQSRSIYCLRTQQNDQRMITTPTSRMPTKTASSTILKYQKYHNSASVTQSNYPMINSQQNNVPQVVQETNPETPNLSVFGCKSAYNMHITPIYLKIQNRPNKIFFFNQSIVQKLKIDKQIQEKKSVNKMQLCLVNKFEIPQEKLQVSQGRKFFEQQFHLNSSNVTKSMYYLNN